MVVRDHLLLLFMKIVLLHWLMHSSTATMQQYSLMGRFNIFISLLFFFFNKIKFMHFLIQMSLFCLTLKTGSGKTYTMGTNYTGEGSSFGIIPKVMDTIFRGVCNKKHNTEFLIRVSFIEVIGNSQRFSTYSFSFPQIWLRVCAFMWFWHDRYSRRKYLICLTRTRPLSLRMKGQFLWSLLALQEFLYKLEKLWMEG